MSNTPIKSRRFLRFRLRTLLLLPLFFAAGWWWVTWPERTAARFVVLLERGELETAQTLLESPQPPLSFQKSTAFDETTPLVPLYRPTSWLDILSARRGFDVTLRPPAADGSSQFVVVRGRVIRNPYIVSHWLSRIPADPIAQLLKQTFADRKDYVIVTDTKDNRILMKAPWELHIRTLGIMMDIDANSAKYLYSRPSTISAETIKRLESALEKP